MNWNATHLVKSGTMAAVLLAIALFAPPAPAMPPPGAAPASPPPAGLAGSEACAVCHEAQFAALTKTAHGMTSAGNWDGVTSCESCHGPGQAHAESGDPALIRDFKKLKGPDASAACLSCHERGEQSAWHGSMHDGRNLSCLTCHSIHQGADPHPKLLAKESEFATCGGCHLKRKASLMRSGHMPMREGQMTCSSCHNPHGSAGPSLLKQMSVNENCYSCHAEKQAPMLWEHPPVKENCLTCHDPHGSLHPRLLLAKQPRLCQQCHDETRHPTQPYASASGATPEEFFPNSRMFDRGCMNCHSQIHGSNHPSGVRFTR
jgi:DmsE family decaheme c-type cytochrome